ncbi:transcription factor Opi1-domain-containing protein, partial [Hyaloraphidium curvatum]
GGGGALAPGGRAPPVPQPLDHRQKHVLPCPAPPPEGDLGGPHPAFRPRAVERRAEKGLPLTEAARAAAASPRPACSGRRSEEPRRPVIAGCRLACSVESPPFTWVSRCGELRAERGPRSHRPQAAALRAMRTDGDEMQGAAAGPPGPAAAAARPAPPLPALTVPPALSLLAAVAADAPRTPSPALPLAEPRSRSRTPGSAPNAAAPHPRHSARRATPGPLRVPRTRFASEQLQLAALAGSWCQGRASPTPNADTCRGFPPQSPSPSPAAAPEHAWQHRRSVSEDIPPPRPFFSEDRAADLTLAPLHLGTLLPAMADPAAQPSAEHRHKHSNGHSLHDLPPEDLPHKPANGMHHADPELEAAEALGGLRHAVSSPVPASPQMAPEAMPPASTSPKPSNDFISRVSNYPVVNSGIQQISRIYEAGKESHAIVKFGAETVESVGTTVIKKLEPTLGPPLRSLDRFASTSLDRLEQYVPGFRSASGSPPRDPLPPPAEPEPAPVPPPSPGLARAEGGYGGTQPLVQRKPRSTWSAIVTNVGGYVVSEETMRGLRYCLQWLQYATQLIDSRIQLLRSYLARLVPSSSSTAVSTTTGEPVPDDTVVAAVRRDLVETLRGVVDVVGRYAAVVLPTESRENVRRFVLSLPGRWVSLAASRTETEGADGHGTDRFSKLSAAGPAPAPADDARTVLAFASESRTVLGGVENVFRQSFERAEGVLSRIGFSTAGWGERPEGEGGPGADGGEGAGEEQQGEREDGGGDEMEVDG